MHAYLINSVFNFTGESCSRCEGIRNERDSAKRKNETQEKEIKVLKKKSKDYQRRKRALQERLESVEKEQRSLKLFSEMNLEKAKKGQEEKIGQLIRKIKVLENEVTKKTSEVKNILAHMKKVEDCAKKSLAETETKDVELENMSVQNKRLNEESNALRSERDKLREEVETLRLRLRKMPERKCFVQLLP